MPRSPSVGNADTIQQRARFFGYKQGYSGYCRVYLSEDTIHAFRAYVQHEEDVRQQMLDVQNSGQHLDDWKRIFILDPSLRPTRSSVIEGFARFKWRSWIVPKKPLYDAQQLQNRREAVANFISRLNFSMNPSHPARTPSQQHFAAEATLLDVINYFLGQIEYARLRN